MPPSRRKKKDEEVHADDDSDEDDYAAADATAEDELSPRRSSRKRKTMSYNEKTLIKVIGLKEKEAPTKSASGKKRGRPSRKSAKPVGNKKKSRIVESSDEEDEEEQDSDDDSEDSNDGDDFEEVAENSDDDDDDMGGGDESDSEEEDEEEYEDRKPKAKKARTSKKAKRKCQYCDKDFSTAQGLDYHIKHFVCRMEQCIDPEIIVQHDKKNKRKREKGPKGETKYKKFRGKKENRTCEDCGRVFTSVLGLRYHQNKQVCKNKSKKQGGKKSANTTVEHAFQTLEEGEMFVTTFGVVRVIKDDRATPLKGSISDLSKMKKEAASAASKFENSMRNFYIQRFSQLRIRRENINALYQKGVVSQKSIFKSYLDPMNERKKIVRPQNPLELPEFFPDRIVECEWIADNRTRFVGSNREEQDHTLEKVSGLGKLYLQRRMLTEKYDEDGSVYFCDACGKGFPVVPSYTYHSDRKPCKRRNEIEKNRRSEMEISIRKHANALREVQAVVQKAIRRTPKRKKHKLETAVYPEVLIALGFQFRKRDETDSNEIIRLAVAGLRAGSEPEPPSSQTNSASAQATATQAPVAPKQAPAKPVPTLKPVKKEDPPLEDPTIVMHDLQKDLKREMRIADDKVLGSMYTEVYHSLGFQYPGLPIPKAIVAKKKIIVIKKSSAPKKKKPKKKKSLDPAPKPVPSAALVTAPAPPRVPRTTHPLPAIIDPQALVDEALAGRYPSIRRFEGEHGDRCSVCKRYGHLLCCDFCETVEHWKCFRTKFTTKALEPGESFMCHKCIGVVIARRNRAEKRLADKNFESKRKGDKESDRNDGNRQHRIVAKKGQETCEIMELLRDSQNRLNQSVARMEMNDLRRQMLAEM